MGVKTACDREYRSDSGPSLRDATRDLQKERSAGVRAGAASRKERDRRRETFDGALRARVVGRCEEIGDDVRRRFDVQAVQLEAFGRRRVAHEARGCAAQEPFFERAVRRDVDAFGGSDEDRRRARLQRHHQRERVADCDDGGVFAAHVAQEAPLREREPQQTGPHVARDVANVAHRDQTAARHRGARPDVAQRFRGDVADEREMVEPQIRQQRGEFDGDAFGNRGLAVPVTDEQNRRHAAGRSGTSRKPLSSKRARAALYSSSLCET